VAAWPGEGGASIYGNLCPEKSSRLRGVNSVLRFCSTRMRQEIIYIIFVMDSETNVGRGLISIIKYVRM